MKKMPTGDDTKHDSDESSAEVLLRSMQATRHSYEKDTLNSRPFQGGLRYLCSIPAVETAFP